MNSSSHNKNKTNLSIETNKLMLKDQGQFEYNINLALACENKETVNHTIF